MRTQQPKVSEEKPRDLETGATVGSSEVTIVDPGASWWSPEKGEPVFSSSPRSPLLHNGAQERWPIDADAPWKSYGRLRGTARTDPSTALSTELGKPAKRMPVFHERQQAGGAPSRSARSVILFITNGPYTRWKPDPGNTINPSTESGQVHTLAKVVYALPLDQAKGVKVEMHGVAADTRARRAAFDEAFDSWADFDPPVRIRRLTPEELALIWFYIGWDISEPILVVEAGSHTLVVDFTDDGESLHWLEDISQPCFQAVVGGGTRRGSCFCSVVISEKGRYAVTFQRRSEQDPPCPVAQPPTEPPGAGPEASTQGFEMISVVLYQPDQILRARVPSVEALTAYLKELQGVCGRFFAGSTRLETLDVVVAVRPGRSKVWFVSSGGPEQEARLNSLREQLEAVPVLDVRRGPVAFAIVGAVAGARRTLPSTAAVYQAPMPKEWKDAAAQIGTTVQVPDGILEVVWPEKK